MAKQVEKKATQVWPVIREYSKAAWKYPVLLALIIVGSLIIEIAGIVAPLFIRQFINALSTADPAIVVVGHLFLILAYFALTNFAGWIGRRIQMLSLMHIEARVIQDLSNAAFANLLGHSHNFFSSNFAGTLTRRVTRYSRAFEQVLDSVTFNFFSTGVFAIGAIFVLSQKNIFIGGALLLWTIIFITIQVGMAKYRQPLRLARAAEDSKVTGLLSDAISNQSAIHLFAAGSVERKSFAQAVLNWKEATMKSWIADAWVFAVQGLFAIAIEVGLLAGALVLWKHQVITVGDFVLIQVYIIGLIDRIWGIGNSMRKLYDAFADAHEMIEILETPYDVQDAKDATALVVTEGTVAMKDVGFNFVENRTILKDFTCTIAGAEKVALVGPSGAGKSTITKLLLRFYDVTEGSICIDGQDIRTVTQDSLHEAIAFVPQEPVLFHRSLMENIRYGRHDASDEEVIEAAKKAHCHEFIASLPEGYATHVGERGVKLSGGERQRVAIARAILKNAPLLILDEATSSLDSESESLIQDALNVLMEGKTVIVIAHRLSTIMTMDRILVVEDGAVVAQGTHDELLQKKGGLYHKLWSIQAGGFIAN